MHFDVHIYTVKKWAGEFLLVVLELTGRACASFLVRAKVAARAGIHGGDEHEVGWVGGVITNVAEGYLVVFERLTQCFEGIAVEFWKFIKIEYAKMGERNLARKKLGGAADNSSASGAVMRRAEGALCDNRLRIGGEGVELSDSDLLGGAEGR